MGSNKNIILFSLVCFLFLEVSAQVGIGTTAPNASSSLDIQSNNSGVLIPRIGLTSPTDVVTIPNPALSLLVYNTGILNGLSPGYYFWDGTRWNRVMDSSNDNLNKVYGEIYNSSAILSYPSMQNVDTTVPIRFEVSGEIQGVTPIPLTSPYQGFEIIRSGIYRVSYSISIELYSVAPASALTVGFYLTTGVAIPINTVNLLANSIPGSFTRSHVIDDGDTSYSMSKIVHLNAGDHIRLFSNKTYTVVYVKPDSATLNIELIKAD